MGGNSSSSYTSCLLFCQVVGNLLGIRLLVGTGGYPHRCRLSGPIAGLGSHVFPYNNIIIIIIIMEHRS